jgi:AcrR family transcriptional regulator
MSSTTRRRLLDAASRLFAEHGFRGASVRDICDQANANPGAVSYHFGGKRQLYRAVVRHAADDLVRPLLAPPAMDEDAPVPGPETVVRRLMESLRHRRGATRLLLRDLADGGEMAVEALVPAARSAHEQLAASLGASDTPFGTRASRERFLQLAAPIALLGTVAPVVCRALEIDEDGLAALLAASLDRSPDGRSDHGTSAG